MSNKALINEEQSQPSYRKSVKYTCIRCMSRSQKQRVANELGRPRFRQSGLTSTKEVNMELQSRLVAKGRETDKSLGLFASTPPLEAKKILFSLDVTEGLGYPKGKEGMKLDLVNFSGAYFQADALRDVYAQLPDENAEPGMCGKLVKSMHGTRDAAQNWGEEYTKFMKDAGFQRGKSLS